MAAFARGLSLVHPGGLTVCRHIFRVGKRVKRQKKKLHLHDQNCAEVLKESVNNFVPNRDVTG